MTYYEILKSGYEFLMHEEIEGEFVEEIFCRSSIKDEVLQKEFKMLYMYLELYMLKKRGLLSKAHQKLLLYLEKELAVEEFSACKKFEKASQKTQKDMQENLDGIEEYLSHVIDDLDTETKEMLQDNIVDDYISRLTRNLKDIELETEVVESAFDNMLETIILSLPYLFFTKEGYKYIPSEFHIIDEKLREECFNYYHDLIYSFYSYHIEYGKEKVFWLIMIKILELILLFISQKDYSKLKRFIEIDSSMFYEKNDCLINCLMSFPKDIEIDLETKAFEATTIPEFLNLFISDNTMFSEFTPYQISIIVIGYFRQVRNKNKAMNLLLARISQIKEIFASQENESQKRIRVYKSAWKDEEI